MSKVQVTLVRQNGSTKLLDNSRDVVMHNGVPVVAVKGGFYAFTNLAPDHVQVDLRQPCVLARSSAKIAAAVARANPAPVVAKALKAPKPTAQAATPEQSAAVQAVIAMVGSDQTLARKIYANLGAHLKALKA